MSKFKLTYHPEGGSKREWILDSENPAWDIQYGTEKATGWAWYEFADRLMNVSAIAVRALIFVLRKRDEPRLELESVEAPMSSWDLEEIPDEKPEEKESGEA